MFFSQTSSGVHTVCTRSQIMSGNIPATPPKLFGEIALLVRLRLSFLGIFASELVSPYLHYCITFFIYILN